MGEKYTIVSMHVGGPKQVVRNGEELYTSFLKAPTTKRIALTETGLVGDGQAVTEHHGGEEKAVCVYPYSHYHYWEKTLGKTMDYPSFGENITVKGLTEENVYLGDIFQWGDAIVQVNQPRKPCNRISFVHQEKTLTKQVTQTGFTGFYMRVIEPGEVSAGDVLERVEQHHEQVSIALVNQTLYFDRKNEAALRSILKVDAIASTLQEQVEKRLKSVVDTI